MAIHTGPGGSEQFCYGCSPASMLLMKLSLQFVELHQQITGFGRRVRYEFGGAWRRRGKLYVAPALRSVHIDHALWRPDPVMFRPVRNFAILPVHNLDIPLHARKVEAPLVAIM